MPRYNINSGVPDYPEGLSDEHARLVVPVYRALNSLAQQISLLTSQLQLSQADLSQLDPLLLARAGDYHKVSVQAAEALAYGQLVNLFVDTGVIKARVATAADLTKPAHAVVDTDVGIANGQWGQVVFMEGRTQGISGSALGQTYWLSTNGQVQTVKPTAPGVISQRVGVGLGSAGFWLKIEPV